jgi:hypothetical protein
LGWQVAKLKEARKLLLQFTLNGTARSASHD